MLKGRVKKDEKTKDLIRRLEPNDIAVLLHKDIDEVAARHLVKKSQSNSKRISFYKREIPESGTEALMRFRCHNN